MPQPIKKRVIGSSTVGFQVRYTTGDDDLMVRLIRTAEGENQIELRVPGEQPIELNRDEALEMYACLSDMREYLLDLGFNDSGRSLDLMKSMNKAYMKAAASVPSDHPLRWDIWESRKNDEITSAVNAFIDSGDPLWLLYRNAKREYDEFVDIRNVNFRINPDELPMSWVGSLVEVKLDAGEVFYVAVRKTQGEWLTLRSQSTIVVIGCISRCLEKMGLTRSDLIPIMDQA